MHQYTGQEDAPRSIQNAFFEGKSIQEMLSLMFKGKISDFPGEVTFDGFSAVVPVAEVNIAYPFPFHQTV